MSCICGWMLDTPNPCTAQDPLVIATPTVTAGLVQAQAEAEDLEERLTPAAADPEEEEAWPLHLLPTKSAQTTANAPCTLSSSALLLVMSDLPRSVLCGMKGNTNSALLTATAAILAPSYKVPSQLHRRAGTSKAFLHPRSACI